MKDKLEEIFRIQEELNLRIGVDTKAISENDFATQSAIKDYTLALRQEISELIDSTEWKWWADYQKFDRQNAKVEVIDCFHFVVSLAQVVGLSADDLFEAYEKKNKINHDRQDSGYSEKNEDDNKDI